MLPEPDGRGSGLDAEESVKKKWTKDPRSVQLNASYDEATSSSYICPRLSPIWCFASVLLVDYLHGEDRCWFFSLPIWVRLDGLSSAVCCSSFKGRRVFGCRLSGMGKTMGSMWVHWQDGRLHEPEEPTSAVLNEWHVTHAAYCLTPTTRFEYVNRCRPTRWLGDELMRWCENVRC